LIAEEESSERAQLLHKLNQLEPEEIHKLEEAFFGRFRRRQSTEVGKEGEMKGGLNLNDRLNDLQAPTETDTARDHQNQIEIQRARRVADYFDQNNSMETVEEALEEEANRVHNQKSSMFKILYPKLVPEYLRLMKWKKGLISKSIFKSRFEPSWLKDNFLDNEKEYFFKCNKGNLGIKLRSDPLENLLKRRKKMKKIKQSWFQPVYSAEEMNLKRSFVKHVQREYIKKGICFQYYYSPESRFNSMEDVIDPIEARAREHRAKALPLSLEHEYHARAFNYPRDDLYSKEEFVTNNFAEEPTELNEGHSQRFRDHVGNKHQIYLNSGFQLSKNYFPINSGVPSKILFKKNIESKYLSTEEARQGKYNNKFKRRDEPEDMYAVSKSFLTDLHEVDRQEIQTYFEHENQQSLPQLFYEAIKKNQEKTMDLNWNGEQVTSRINYPKNRTKKVLDSMNSEDHHIWFEGNYRPVVFFRKYILKLVSHSWFNSFVMFCVLINTLVLMMDNLVSKETDTVLSLINQWLTLVFLIEFILKLIALGIREYCRDGFNIFDGIIVLTSMVEISANLILSNESGSALSAFRALRILRSLRVLRVTRLLRSLKFMTVIIAVIVETLEQFLYVAILLLLFLYIYALLGMQTFGGTFEGFKRLPRNNFDTFLWSFLTIFQLMTFENWVDILELCWNTTVPKWITVLFFFSWICIGNYIFFNLFLALLLGGFDSPSVMLSLKESEDHYKEMQEMIKLGIEREKSIKLERDTRLFNLNNPGSNIMNEDRSSVIEYDEDFLKLSDQQQAIRGVYFPPRDAFDDLSSLDDEFERIFDSIVTPPKLQEKDIFETVTCNYSLYLFSKKNRFRRAISTIASSEL
jgi:hypothetical protein